jgi:hypothetical protein
VLTREKVERDEAERFLDEIIRNRTPMLSITHNLDHPG